MTRDQTTPRHRRLLIRTTAAGPTPTALKGREPSPDWTAKTLDSERQSEPWLMSE